MSDYTNTFGGAAKDSGSATILGAEHDTQLDNIATMSATKAEKVNFTSTGIDDNATSTALTLDSSENANFSGNVTLNGILSNSGTNAKTLISAPSDPDYHLRLSTTGSLGYFDFVAKDTGLLLQTNNVSCFETDLAGSVTFAGDVTISKALPTLNITSTQAADNKPLYFRSSGGVEAVINHSGLGESLLIQTYTPDRGGSAAQMNINQSGAIAFNTGGDDTNTAEIGLTLAGRAAGAGATATFAGTITSGAVNSNVKLNTKVLDIGTWDMNDTQYKIITHGLTFSKIRSVTATILDNAGTSKYDIHRSSGSGTGVSGIAYSATTVTLSVQAGGFFDSSFYNAATGWLIIQYTD